MSGRYDLVIVGSGFAGSLLAMIARRLGRSVALVERGTHPRVVIGESSTPLSNLLLEDLVTKYDLPTLLPLTKWGSWQKSYPEIACGLKRGFTFHHHVLGKTASPDALRRDQLLVAASPHDAIADTHWYRADLDAFLVGEAQRLGVEYFDETRLERFLDHGDTVRLEGSRRGEETAFTAKFVVDASGPRGFLHRALGLGELALMGLPATQALYSHFSGVVRLGDTEYSRTDETPPYPIDDAAVHHVFDGGWVWVLQFNNGITSAGVAATDAVAARLRFAEGAAAWERLLARIPALREQFAHAKAVRPFAHLPQLGFRSAAVTGRQWALLPSAAGFVDPLLSTGFPLTLLGLSRLASIFERDFSEWDSGLASYAAKTEGELVAASRLIGALYASMGNFSVFAALSLLYFAAASYSETVRRLGKPELAASFLLYDDARFEPACESLLERSVGDPAEFVGEVLRLIEPFNVAGLGDATRRNWYPVDAEDLFRSARKVGVGRDEIGALLARCGFVGALV